MTYTADDARRDLNPTPEARLAMIMFGHEYSRQNLGCMGFWDGLTETRQHDVRRNLSKIAEAAKLHSVSLDQLIEQ